MAKEILLRRAKSLLVYWRDDRLLFHNFARRLTFAGKPIVWEILDFFGDWRTSQQAVTHFSGYKKKSVLSALSRLVKHGLLLAKHSAEAAQDSLLARQWREWLPEGSFHFSTKDVPYLREKEMSLDRSRFNLPKTPQPKAVKSVKGAKRTPLPPRAFPDSEFARVLLTRKTHRQFSNQELTVEAVSQLLSLVWGVTGYLHIPEFGKLLVKTSPSGGACHPGEVYLMALRIKGLKPGLYRYHPLHHRLELIGGNATPHKAWLYCARQNFVRKAAALFLMTALFGRSMWKYPFGRAYRVVLLDAGHLCQTFCLVATWLGLAPFCTAALQDTLIEDDLKIDGIRESILYVAGVGLPVDRSSSTRCESK